MFIHFNLNATHYLMELITCFMFYYNHQSLFFCHFLKGLVVDTWCPASKKQNKDQPLKKDLNKELHGPREQENE